MGRETPVSFTSSLFNLEHKQGKLEIHVRSLFSFDQSIFTLRLSLGLGVSDGSI